MPRVARVHSPGSLVHVIARFINHQHVLSVPGARGAYLRRLDKGLQSHDCKVLAFSLMSTHLHLAVLAGLAPLGDLFESVHTAFATWFRNREGGLGSIFAGRFKSILFAPEMAGILLPYIHNNEQRAGLVSDPTHSRWSSHRQYVGLRPVPRWLNVGMGLELCGFEPTIGGTRAFDDWVRLRSVDPKLETFGKHVDPETRAAELSEKLITVPNVAATKDLQPPLSPQVHPRWHGDARDVAMVTASRFGVGINELCSNLRYPPLPAARSVLVLAWTRDLGRPQAEVAAVVGMSPQAASKACRRARESPGLSRHAQRVAWLSRKDRVSV